MPEHVWEALQLNFDDAIFPTGRLPDTAALQAATAQVALSLHDAATAQAAPVQPYALVLGDGGRQELTHAIALEGTLPTRKAKKVYTRTGTPPGRGTLSARAARCPSLARAVRHDAAPLRPHAPFDALEVRHAPIASRLAHACALETADVAGLCGPYCRRTG